MYVRAYIYVHISIYISVSIYVVFYILDTSTYVYIYICIHVCIIQPQTLEDKCGQTQPQSMSTFSTRWCGTGIEIAGRVAF